MNRKPNAPKCILGVVMVVLMVIGGLATTPRFSRTTVAASATASTLLPAPASPAPPPVNPTTAFELDGNILDAAGAPDDWQTVNCLGGGSSIVKTGVLADPEGLTIFTTGGSKDDQEITEWRHKDGSVPPKDEIADVYAAKYSVSGETILYFGAERTETSGSAFIGVWFFKNEIGTNPDGTFSGLHAVGDVLVLSEFSNGGTFAQSKVFEWVASGGDEGTHLLDITGTAAAGSVFSIANGSPIPAPPCWPYTPNGGVLGGDIPANAFFEGGINIDAFPALAGSCFSSFLVETRSSFSTTATLKDFRLGSFNTCATCEIAGPTPVCTGATNLQYTSSGVFIATHSWSFTTNTSGATFCGPTNQATVCVNAGPTGGTFTLRDDITGTGGGASFCVKTVTVNQTPPAPSTTGAARCGPGVVNLSASGCDGGTLTWYDAASGGNVVNTGPTFSPNLTTTTTFFVSCTQNNCEGARASVTGTINAIPAAPTTTGDARCGPGVVNLSAGGCTGTLTWYDAASGGNVVNTGATFSPNLTVTTTFHVSCTSAAGCEGPRAPVTGTINANPTVTITTASACATSISLTATASGGSGSGFTFLWTLPDASTSTDNPLVVTAPGNYSVTVTDSSGCTGSTCNIVGLCLNGACANGSASTRSSAKAPATVKSKKAKPKSKKN